MREIKNTDGVKVWSWYHRGCKECHTPVGYIGDETEVHIITIDTNTGEPLEKIRYAWICGYCTDCNLRDEDGFIN